VCVCVCLSGGCVCVCEQWGGDSKTPLQSQEISFEQVWPGRERGRVVVSAHELPKRQMM